MSEAAGSSEAEGEAAKGSGERGGSRGSFKSVVQNLFEHNRELATASPSFGGQEQSMSKRNWVDAVTLAWLAAASLKAATLQRGETYSCPSFEFVGQNFRGFRGQILSALSA